MILRERFCKTRLTNAKDSQIDPANVSSESMSNIVVYTEETNRNVNNNFNKRKFAMAIEVHVGQE